MSVTPFPNAGPQALSEKLGEQPSVLAYATGGVDKTGATDSRAGLILADTDVVSIGGHLLFPAGIYKVANNLTISSHCRFSPGAIIQPASGKKVTFAQPITAGLHQIFDYSLGGTVVLVAQPLNPEWWGAITDGTTDCKPALQAALDQGTAVFGPTIRLQAGRYICHGSLTKSTYWNGVTVEGAGAAQTYIDFTDNTVTACIDISGALLGFDQLRLIGFTINGPGKTSGTNVHGLYIFPASGAPAGLLLRDIRASNLSGNGIYVVNAFDCRYYDVWVENIGGAYGIAIGGDQGTTFINSGQYNTGVGVAGGASFSWWFMEGAPFLQGLNTDDVPNGIRFGSLVTDPRNIQFCHPTIIGLNVERCTGGVGIQYETGSNAAFGTGITLYAGPLGADKGMYWKGAMNSSGLCVPPPGVVPGSGGGAWTTKFHSDGAGVPNHGVTLFVGDDQSADFNSTIVSEGLIQQILPNAPSSGPPIGFRIGQALISPGVFNSGPETRSTQTVSAGYTVVDTDRDINVDASGAARTITIPNPSSVIPGRLLTITKVDTSNNAVDLSCGVAIGGTISNALTVPDQSMTIRANAAGTKWDVISATFQPWVRTKYGNGTFAGLPTLTIGDPLNALTSLTPLYVSDSSVIIPGDAAAGGGGSRVLVIANPFTGNWVVLVPLIH